MAKVESAADPRFVLYRRLGLFGRQFAEGAIGRMGAFGNRLSDLHIIDDMVAWPRFDARTHGRKHDANGDFHKVSRQ